MTSFASLPFEEQLARIDALVERAGDPLPLVRDAGALPDAEPLGRLLDALAARDRVAALEDELRSLLPRLADPALQHLLMRPSHPKLGSLLEASAEEALLAWPAERIGALALLSRWLRKTAPERYRRVLEIAEEKLREDTDGRWLFFASGRRLAELARDPGRRELVETTAARVIDALARAPKSISQANAERLLAQRVYADPGHLFFELLQNADDAGASAWSAAIEGDRVTVSHDGAPFSFLDLVGVLSIGQTTKRADQIGFFGVGFKSVYEICERPRVYSGALSFEIAHVSIPRQLAPIESEQTVLVLPFARAIDAAMLHTRALAIPPETLMTLQHVRRTVVRGPSTEARIWERRGEGADVELVGESLRRYRREERTLRLDARESTVLVAIARDERGAPIPILGPTLYAFLPTAERSGLRVLVHARFDVTLDRERLELGSAWNDALLACAGSVLGDAVIGLAEGGARVLPILSSDEELAPSMRSFAAALRAGVSDRPCLPGAAGELLAPSRARLTTPALAIALAGVDLEGARALADLSTRERAVAASLGAQHFGPDDLLRWLRATLIAGQSPPPWLGAAVLEAIAHGPRDALSALPILVDGGGRLVAARDARLAPPAWAELYAGERPVVSRDARPSVPKLDVEPFDPSVLVADLRDPSRRARLVERGALFDALGDLSEELLHDLADAPIWPLRAGGRAALTDGVVVLEPSLERLALPIEVPILARSVMTKPAARIVPRFGFAELASAIERGIAMDPAEITALLDEVAEALPRSLARRFAALPLFRDRRGERRPLVGEGRVLAAHELEAVLPTWPWIDGGPFLDAVDPPRVDARAVACAMIGDPALPAIPHGALALVQAWLGAHAGELSSRELDALARAPIWIDAAGAPRALDALRRGTPSVAIDAFYAALGGRWVAAPDTLRFARALGLDARLPASDFGTVVADLLREPPDLPRALIAGVLDEASRALRPHELAPLAAIAIFSDEGGTLRPLATWDRADDRACHRPGAFRAVLRAGSLPLLSEEDEELFSSWLEVAGPRGATPTDVIARVPDLARDPEALLAFASEHAGALDEPARRALATLPIFRARDGSRRAAIELTDGEVFTALGEERLTVLALDDALLDPSQRALADRLGATLRSAAALLEQRVLDRLVPDTALDAQPAPWRTREDTLALLALAHRAGADVAAYPLELDLRLRLVRGPLAHASEAARALVRALPLASKLADPEWAASLPREHSLAVLEPRRIAEALRIACSSEAPAEGHPIIDPPALFRWLREAGPQIAADEAAKGALEGAAILPSRRGTLRAARDLVLDPSLPDLDLDWGLAPDVPPDVARWLRATFELDRRAREAIVVHVLDGVDEAAKADDRERAARLIAFLASALGAGEVPAAALEERVRRASVRARLKVPVENDEWQKPRFAWTPSDDAAAYAEAFALDLPPRIVLPELGAAARALLAAAGARSDLDEATVERCLEGEGLRAGAASRRALARYVIDRALAVPARKAKWKLAERSWVPSEDGSLHRPADLIWPDALARSLFGERSQRFPDPELVFDLPEDAADRLGFSRAARLDLSEVARDLVDGEARPALLDWIEAGLTDGRLDAAAVRAALRDRIELRDDEGVLRAASELAQSGARALFGPWRGDYTDARSRNKLARALEIPARPSAAMIAEFLAEIGERLESFDDAERDLLSHHLPLCLETLGKLADERALAPGSAIAGMRAGRVVLARVGDPALRMLAPAELAEAIEDFRGLVDPLPSERDERLARRLLASGVPDLGSAFDIEEIVPGVRRDAFDGEAESLRARLATGLGAAVGKRARVFEALSARGVLRLGAQSQKATVSVDAALDGEVLLLTPAALASPILLAPALSRDPVRRAAIASWLAAGTWEKAPQLAKRAPEEVEPREPEARGFLSRLKSLIGGAQSSPKAARPSAPERRDDGFFKPAAEVETQLDRNEGWLDARRVAPDFGFAFTPPSLEAPWIYAPKLIATGFDRRFQRWDQARVARPEVRGSAGMVVMQGRLPRGEAIAPVPLYGRLVELRVDGDGMVDAVAGPNGAVVLRVGDPTQVRLKISLGALPDFARARPASVDAMASFVPDDELPDEVLDFLVELDPEQSALDRALSVRDFVRSRYRYDPTYLEDPALGHWLARITRGRANVHVAALHAGRDARHLGAGVCYELNSLACELLRRAGIPAALATGWVFSGGSLSEPDHLWSIALLEDAFGGPIWLPIDASSTAEGRPLRVPRRPPGRFRAPRDASAKAPAAPKWAREERAAPGPGKKREKRKKAPIAELHRVLRYLAQQSGAALDPNARAALTRALADPREAAKLLRRILG